jgi:YD repeat-containing protein
MSDLLVGQYQYNAFSQVTRIIDALTEETVFAYDPNGNLLSLTGARNKTTAYTYNTMDRVSTRTDPLARVEQYVYDANGSL